jgi:hypothetical protein
MAQDQKTNGLQFDLTPDPRVLVALTHTPLQPLDALCELIDNGIDAFRSATLEGRPEEHPLVLVDLPGSAEVSRGDGIVRIRDNGAGLTPEKAERAMRAGFSGNNPYDTLGLFGMGFNISTGKLGRRTTLVSARADEDHAIEVVLDLVALQETGSYVVPVQRIPKPEQLPHGTMIEVTGWWPEGNANAGFIRRLAGFSKPTVRQQIGRRYSTLLREDNVRVILNGEACQPFEHCVWSSARAVEKQGHGRIPARFDFDEVLGSQRRCRECFALVGAVDAACAVCGSASFRTLEERIRGWVGIQRFDNQTDFGVDLVRNGRAIRVFEQAAFFTFTDELKQVIRDYPIDGTYGRIVGEVHLDHVPVDFLKQDFQRSSSEWISAIEFLRGKSSLQPSQPGAEDNKSYIYKLYQGYRRVRNPGKRDMYMGYWDEAAQKPKRISRDVERDYYTKFEAKLPGYHDDTEWWKRVEEADQPPAASLVDCPACGAQNLEGAELCGACDEVLMGKDCINCGELVAASALSCPLCGADQQPEVLEPWSCAACAKENVPTDSVCVRCGAPRGSPAPASREGLVAVAQRSDELSIRSCTVLLADNAHSTPLEVITHVISGPIRESATGEALPLVSFRGSELEIFLDVTHPIIKTLQVRPQDLIALETAQYLYESNRALKSSHPAGHSLTMLAWQILRDRWPDELELSGETVRSQIIDVFSLVRLALPNAVGNRSRDLYEELTSEQEQALVTNWMDAGQDIPKLQEAADSGKFIQFCDEQTLMSFFRIAPDLFFDGAIWDDEYAALSKLSPVIAQEAQHQLTSRYLSALEDCGRFLRLRDPDELSVRRAQASVQLLQTRLA